MLVICGITTTYYTTYVQGIRFVHLIDRFLSRSFVFCQDQLFFTLGWHLLHFSLLLKETLQLVCNTRTLIVVVAAPVNYYLSANHKQVDILTNQGSFDQRLLCLTCLD